MEVRCCFSGLTDNICTLVNSLFLLQYLLKFVTVISVSFLFGNHLWVSPRIHSQIRPFEPQVSCEMCPVSQGTRDTKQRDLFPLIFIQSLCNLEYLSIFPCSPSLRISSWISWRARCISQVLAGFYFS